MTKYYKKSIKNSMLTYIESVSNNIVLRKDVAFLGSPRQISRGFKALIEAGQLVRIGMGIYAKARKSKYIDGLVIRNGFTEACIEILQRLEIHWELSQSIKDYNSGKSQQVPARFEIRLKTRFRRKLAYGNQFLKIEGNIYAQ